MTAGTGDEIHDVLVVCTGNVCRSPAAQVHLAAALGPHGVRVRSAGLRALVGEPIDPAMDRLLAAPTGAFRARQLTPDALRSAGLVLVMTKAQRRAVVTDVTSVLRRTFTLLELAAIADLARRQDVLAGPVSRRLAALRDAAPTLRAQRPVDVVDDIPDPRGGDEPTFRRVETAIRNAVATVVGAVGADPPS